MKFGSDYLILTNNPLVNRCLDGLYALDFRPDCGYREILIVARDQIHRGHKLYTHPLSGSVKPNETPYKSIVLSKTTRDLDTESVSIIGESVTAFDKFPKKNLVLTEKLASDFQLIDYTLLCGALDIDAAARLSIFD